MGQFANIIINDGTATPVAVTFYAQRVPNDPGKLMWVDRRKTVTALQPYFVLTQSPASTSRPTHRLNLELVYPIEGVVNGLPAPVSVLRWKDGAFVIPDGAPATDRAHAQAFVANIMDNALVKALNKDLDYIF